MKVEVSNRVRLLPPYIFGRLNAIKYEKRRKGLDVIDLGMGNPLDPTPSPVVEKLCHAVRDPRNHRYSSATGIFNLKREVAKQYALRYGVDADPSSEIVCTIGSKEGFSHLCLALLGPDDSAIVPQPSFPIHTYSIRLAGASVVGVPLESEEQLVANSIRVGINELRSSVSLTGNLWSFTTSNIYLPINYFDLDGIESGWRWT